jgi:acyl-coenzyme A thioesterase PaaI-like protein
MDVSWDSVGATEARGVLEVVEEMIGPHGYLREGVLTTITEIAVLIGTAAGRTAGEEDEPQLISNDTSFIDHSAPDRLTVVASRLAAIDGVWTWRVDVSRNAGKLHSTSLVGVMSQEEPKLVCD